MLGFGSDGAPSLVQTRTPPPSVIGLPNIPTSTNGYSYTIMKLGPLQFTRKGLSVASTSACLSFAVCPFLLWVIFSIQIVFFSLMQMRAVHHYIKKKEKNLKKFKQAH